MEKIKVLLDTSVLMGNLDGVKQNIDTYQFVICSVVSDELDKHKESSDGFRSFKSRQALKFIEKNIDKLEFVLSDIVDKINNIDFDVSHNDTKILNCAVKHNFSISTLDRGMMIRCHSLNMKTIDLSFEENEYMGFKEVILDIENSEDDKETLAGLYQDYASNIFNNITNEYVTIKDSYGEVIDVFRWDSEKYVPVFNKSIKGMYLGNLRPKDEQQRMAIDSLFNHQVSMIKGKAGSGKSLISLSYAMYMIEKGKYDKLIIFVNPCPAKGAVKYGFLPGSLIEKILDTSVGNMLASKFGSRIALERLIEDETIVLLPFSDLRGFDTSGKKAIIYITEAQNLDIELMRLALQRVGEDCQVILDGDYSTQIDMQAFEGVNNGMRRVSDIFKGENIYGEVELQNIYRSKIAEIADRM